MKKTFLLTFFLLVSFMFLDSYNIEFKIPEACKVSDFTVLEHTSPIPHFDNAAMQKLGLYMELNNDIQCLEVFYKKGEKISDMVFIRPGDVLILSLGKLNRLVVEKESGKSLLKEAEDKGKELEDQIEKIL